MSLEQKSKENIEVVRHYLNKKKCYNAVAGRLYYSIFQKIKYYFENKSISYAPYKNKDDRKDYSHGTVLTAIKGEI